MSLKQVEIGTVKKHKNKNWRIGGNYNKTETMKYKQMLNNVVNSQIYFPLRGETISKIQQLKSIRMPETFRLIFIDIYKIAQRKSDEYKKYKDARIMRMFYEIFHHHSKTLFGPLSNRKRFFGVINLIITRSAHECIFLSSICQQFDTSEISWLQEIDEFQKPDILLTGLRLLLNIIVIPSLNKTLYPLSAGQSHEVKFVPRVLWNAYLQKVTVDLIRKKYIIPVTYNEKSLQLCRGELQIKPKNGLSDFANIRPYVRLDFKRNNISKLAKHKILKMVIRFAHSFRGAQKHNFFEHWRNFERINRDEQIYGITLDVADCFGNVNIDVLKDIITTSRTNQLSIGAKNVLLHHIDNPYIILGRSKKQEKIWRWNHGLLQGDIFSAVLCELYMSYLDSKTLTQFITPFHFLFRKVDDYLFCSKNSLDIHKFVEKVKINFVLKEEKSVTNLYNLSTGIEYCGQIIHLGNKAKRVTCLYKFPEQCQIRHRFKLWNVNMQLSERGLMAKTFCYMYNNFHFRKTVLNLNYNDLETNFENFYNGMVFIALKFDCCVMAIDRKGDVAFKDFFEDFIRCNVWYYASRFMSQIRPKGDKREAGFGIKLGYLAFETVLNERNLPVYKEILHDIREKRKLMYMPKLDWNQKFRRIPETFRRVTMHRKFNPLLE